MDEWVYFKIEVKEISSFDLYAVVEAPFLGLELRVWGLIDIVISFELFLIGSFSVIDG